MSIGTEQMPAVHRQLSRRVEPTVVEIIQRGRSVKAPARGAWFLSGLTAVLMWGAFTPLDWAPLGWVALVPLILLARIHKRCSWMYTAVFVGGVLNALFTLQWMRYGDVAMYPAWCAMAVYMGLYFPLFVGLSRVAVHRLSLPLTVVVPVVWVGLEFVRAHFLTGFAWYFLGHTQYQWIELIQISDVIGAYGVSFLIAMCAASLAGLVPVSLLNYLKLIPANATHETRQSEYRTPKSQIGSIAAVLAVLASVLGYGYFRRSQADFQPGPRFALVQANFTPSLKHDSNQWNAIYHMHRLLTGRSVPHQPDVIVWPETMFRSQLLEAPAEMTEEQLQTVSPRVPVEMWRDQSVRETLVELSQMTGAALVIGINTLEAERDRLHHYNSAQFVRPDTGLQGRYDKLHRVPFGEYIPWKDRLPWIARLTPFSDDFGLSAGDSAALFQYRGWSFSPLICFEDTVPHLVRRIVKSTNQAATERGEEDSHSRGIDCLVNLTNDGWFHGSSELDQHLITAAFRAVECRTPMVRAVNTGISAVIDGDGMIVEPDVFLDGDGKGRDSMRDPQTGKWHRQLNAVLVDTVPLDNRTSLYVEYGDWFAGSCSTCCALLFCVGLVPRRRT